MRYVPLLLALFLIGCGPTTVRYQVFLKNETPDALTIGLAKNGGAGDPLWESPEEMAIDNPGTERTWGVIVPPGKTADTPVVKGKFYNGEMAFLRIYGNGELSHLDFSRLLAISRGSPNRLDLRLEPGPNFFLIREEGGMLSGLRIDRPTR
jgi:hypothetical protein